MRVDMEELLATRLLVQGNSGSGKSHLLRRLLEESAGMVQQIIIDPEGDFASLSDHFGHVVIDASAHSAAEIVALAARVLPVLAALLPLALVQLLPLTARVLPVLVALLPLAARVLPVQMASV